MYFRATFSPIFTSGKMRSMYRFMLEIGSRLTDELGDKAEADTDFELKVISVGTSPFENYGKFFLFQLVVIIKKNYKCLVSATLFIS